MLQWLMSQSGIGPSFGQAHDFMRAAKEIVPYDIERQGKEVARPYGVVNGSGKPNTFPAISIQMQILPLFHGLRVMNGIVSTWWPFQTLRAGLPKSEHARIPEKGPLPFRVCVALP
jgi:hypothetical protein